MDPNAKTMLFSQKLLAKSIILTVIVFLFGIGLGGGFIAHTISKNQMIECAEKHGVSGCLKLFGKDE